MPLDDSDRDQQVPFLPEDPRYQLSYNSHPQYTGNLQPQYMNNQQPQYMNNQQPQYVNNQQPQYIGLPQPQYTGFPEPQYTGNPHSNTPYPMNNPIYTNPESHQQIPIAHGYPITPIIPNFTTQTKPNKNPSKDPNSKPHHPQINSIESDMIAPISFDPVNYEFDRKDLDNE